MVVQQDKREGKESFSQQKENSLMINPCYWCDCSGVDTDGPSGPWYEGTQQMPATLYAGYAPLPPAVCSCPAAGKLLLANGNWMHVCLCCFHAKSGCLATNDSEGVLVWELKLRTEWQRRFGGVAWAKLSGKEAKHTAEVGITPNLCNVLQPCLLCLLPWARFCSQEQGGKLGWSFYWEANGREWAVSKQPDSLIMCFSWVNLDRHPEGCTTCSLSVDPELHWIKRWNFSIQISCSNRNFATCWACFPHIYPNEVDDYKIVFSLFCLCRCYRKDSFMFCTFFFFLSAFWIIMLRLWTAELPGNSYFPRRTIWPVCWWQRMQVGTFTKEKADFTAATVSFIQPETADRKPRDCSRSNSKQITIWNQLWKNCDGKQLYCFSEIFCCHVFFLFFEENTRMKCTFIQEESILIQFNVFSFFSSNLWAPKRTLPVILVMCPMFEALAVSVPRWFPCLREFLISFFLKILHPK